MADIKGSSGINGAIKAAESKLAEAKVMIVADDLEGLTLKLAEAIKLLGQAVYIAAGGIDK